MDANLGYMWENFGFYLPDSEFLEDPEGQLKYLVLPPQSFPTTGQLEQKALKY